MNGERGDPHLRAFAEEGLRYPMPPSRQGYLTSGDCRIFFAVFGTGRPVILLHGGMGNATNWAKQIAGLTESGYQAIVMDTRGHGHSTGGSERFSYALFAKDVVGLVEHLALNQVILVGWSDGACTALEVARVHPALVAGIVFFACNVDPSGTRDFRMTEGISNCLARHQLDFQSMTPGLEPFALLQPRLEPIQKNEPNYTRHQLGQITTPVAVVQGTDDEFIKREHAEFLAQALGRGQLTLLSGLGHFAPIEDPRTFNDVLLQRLAEF